LRSAEWPSQGKEVYVRYRLIFALGLAAVCTACSAPQGAPASAASPDVASAAPAPAAAAADSPIADGPLYFGDLLQRRDFGTAFTALPGADQLPAWPRQGGTSTPAQHVELGGRQQWLVTACKPHDCPAERMLVLYDESTHAMSGVFARRKSEVADDVDSNDPANDDLIWLGEPDEAAKRLLLAKLYPSE
jgi:hypothetical protein